MLCASIGYVLSGKIYINPDKQGIEMARQKLVDKVLNRIYGHGKGWVFSTKDFADLGPTESVSRSLRRLSAEGKVVRVFRESFSILNTVLSSKNKLLPDPNAIALAISRIRGGDDNRLGPFRA